MFTIGLTFCVMMAVMAFFNFPVWNVGFAVVFGIVALIFRPRRQPKK